MAGESITVIGAGIAGIAAARALQEEGFKVKVLEARDRPGGRILTQGRIDLGAHWIHGTEGNPITNLARQYGVETVFVGGDSTYCGGWEAIELYRSKRGKVSADEKWQSILLADRMRDALDELRRTAVKDHRSDISVQQAVSEVLPMIGMSEEDFRKHLAWHVALFARDDCAATPDSLSAFSWDEGYEVFGYGDSVFLNGYGSLITRLAEGLDIRFNEVVEEISHHPNEGEPSRVRTRTSEYRSHRVVVTLPLGVLKTGHVRFDPPLPAAKVAAIGRLGVGTLGKVVLFFTEVFWKKDQYVFGYLGDDPLTEPTHIINLWKTHRMPCLMILAGGKLGQRLEQSSLDENREWAMRVLEESFGQSIPEPLRVFKSEWSVDEFSLGAYTYMNVGATPDDCRKLAEPVGDWLHFAGEATNSFQWGCVHGAYTSGLREAARITGDASILPVRHFSENRRWREMMLRASRFFNQQMRVLDESDIRSRIAVLTASDVFARVSPNELRLLATMFEDHRYSTGETICRFDDEASEIFVVADGQVEIWLPGEPSANESAGVGTVLGEYGMFTAARRNATLIAGTPVRLLGLDYQRFERFLLAFPESMLLLFKQTVQRFMAQQKH